MKNLEPYKVDNNWYLFNQECKPNKVGRYLIYRAGCDKIQFEKWNGSGWAYSNKDCTHWMEIPTKPTL